MDYEDFPTDWPAYTSFVMEAASAYAADQGHEGTMACSLLPRGAIETDMPLERMSVVQPYVVIVDPDNPHTERILRALPYLSGIVILPNPDNPHIIHGAAIMLRADGAQVSPIQSDLRDPMA